MLELPDPRHGRRAVLLRERRIRQVVHVVRHRSPLLGVDLVAVVVQGGGDRQAPGVEEVLAAEQVVGRGPDRVHEVRRLVTLSLARSDDDLLGLRCVALGGGDVALLRHLVEDEPLDTDGIGIAGNHEPGPALAVLLCHSRLARIEL